MRIMNQTQPHGERLARRNRRLLGDQPGLQFPRAHQALPGGRTLRRRLGFLK